MELILDNDFSDEYRMLGLNIAYYRKIRNMTQLQLAEKIGISRTHISNIEAPNVPTSISVDVIFRISRVLKITPARLLSFPFDDTDKDTEK